MKYLLIKDPSHYNPYHISTLMGIEEHRSFLERDPPDNIFRIYTDSDTALITWKFRHPEDVEPMIKLLEAL